MNTRLLVVALGLLGSSVVIACTSSGPNTGSDEAAVTGDDDDSEGKTSGAKNTSSSSSSGSSTSADAGAGIPASDAASPASPNPNAGGFDPNGDLKKQYRDCINACDEEDADCFDTCDAKLSAAVGGGEDGEDGADGNGFPCCNTSGQAFLCPDQKSCSANGIKSCNRRADLDDNCAK